jgi:uncharacterized membrane protein
MATEWLSRESKRWADDGLITSEQRRAILDRYPDDTPGLFGGATLAWLAWLVAGFGVILLVVWNWEALPQTVRVGGTLAASLGAAAASWMAARRGRAGRAELLAFAATLLAGACIAAVTEMWMVGDNQTWPLLLWAAIIALAALVVASPTTAAFGAGVLLFWVMTDTGRPPVSWLFLPVFLALALSLERRTHWWASACVSLAFGGWVVLTAMEVWRTPSAAAVAFLLAAGAALDAWAHRGAAGRPAFARPTPALAFMIGGFALMTASALSRSTPGLWMTDPRTMVPAVVLLFALLAVALWNPAASTPGVHLRARLVAGAAVVWTITWITTGAISPMPAALAWIWLAVSSAGLVGLTVSAIREAGATHNRAVLLAGIASILTLILMHVTGGPNRFGRSALVLLISAAALWWSTSRHKTSPSQPEV